MSDDKIDHWLTRPGTVRKLWWISAVVLAITVLLQFVFKVKGYFGVDSWFGFGAVYGFGCCVAMVLVAKALGAVLKRGEDYYHQTPDNENLLNDTQENAGDNSA
ncbi:MAG: hypothetical protein AAF434_17955 [Pseudomonadota bacterium]